MKVNFKDCLAETLKWEGGYSNHPKDPGGKTQWGIIQRVYNSYRRLKQLTPRDVKKITRSEMEDIYKSSYWDAVKGDLLPIGLDLVVFDFGVNSGPHRSIKFLQKALNKAEGRKLKIDGLMGPATLDAATSVENLPALISRVCDDRLGWLHTLGTWVTFGKGWGSRVKGVKATALEMASEGIQIIQERPTVPEGLGAAGDITTPSETPWKLSLTGLITACGAGLVGAVNNPFALAFMLALLAVVGYGLYSYAKNIHISD
jgi:lysozyme family protein